MNKKLKKKSIELTNYLVECFGKNYQQFLIDGNLNDVFSIIISGFMSALANILSITADYTNDKDVIEETKIYIRKLLNSVPECDTEITDLRKH